MLGDAENVNYKSFSRDQKKLCQFWNKKDQIISNSTSSP